MIQGKTILILGGGSGGIVAASNLRKGPPGVREDVASPELI